jgi:hypothetical protein
LTAATSLGKRASSNVNANANNTNNSIITPSPSTSSHSISALESKETKGGDMKATTTTTTTATAPATTSQTETPTTMISPSSITVGHHKFVYLPVGAITLVAQAATEVPLSSSSSSSSSGSSNTNSGNGDPQQCAASDQYLAHLLVDVRRLVIWYLGDFHKSRDDITVIKGVLVREALHWLFSPQGSTDLTDARWYRTLWIIIYYDTEVIWQA